MSEFKGTPGKWKVYGLHLIDFNINAVITEKDVICHVNTNKEDTLLISKAPEMLEMLQNILDNEYVSGQTYDEIEQLIKQATEI